MPSRKLSRPAARAASQDEGPDPSENVKALSEAGNVRQDDLREETNRRIDAELNCIRQQADLRAHQTEFVAQLRADHSREIRELESRRLDAIRQVDVLAVGRTAEQQLAAVQTLAATTTSTAENIRSSVTTTASALATQLANTVTGLTERISALEKSSYTGAGEKAVADPAMAQLVLEIKKLSEGAGERRGGSQFMAGLAVIVSLLIAAGSIAVAVLK